MVKGRINRKGAFTNGVHRMGRELEHAVKDECATLKEAVTPVPTIILNYMVSFRLDPKVERDKDDTTNPAVRV